MNWQEIIGHQKQQQMFARAIARQRLGHAYLFAGPSGIGKKLFARLLAASLFCQNRDPLELTCCGHCPACRQVTSKTHPDLFELELPEGKSELPIELFIGSAEKRGKQGLCHDLSLSAMQGGYRIAIIDDADTMSIAAANALLKTLEEPGPGSVLILIATDSDAVIQTIRSRCQQIYFGKLLTDDVLQFLQLDQQHEQCQALTSAQRASLADQADGSIGSAIQLAESLLKPIPGKDQFLKLLGQSSLRCGDLASTAGQIFSQFGTDTLSQRSGAELILSLCLNHFQQRLRHTQVAAEILDCWADVVDLCLESLIQVDRRANIPSVLDAFYQQLEITLQPTWNLTATPS